MLQVTLYGFTGLPYCY